MKNTMTTIRDSKLFAELQTTPEWETLWTTDETGHYPIPKVWIPTLRGGLDHISSTKKYVTFHDIGVNNKCRSFRIAPTPTEAK